MHRRTFLQMAAGASLAATTWPGLAEAVGEKKRVGLIGSGWYGKSDLFRLIQVAPVDVVAICDVDRHMLDNAAEMTATRQISKKKPRTHRDYREMLREKDLDIVLIATPDHWHPLAMIAAAESGADVYVQKPISVDVRESQAMLAVARKTGRVVQVGMQRRSTPHLVEARNQIVKEGKLGTVALVEICCYYAMRTHDNPPDTAAPEYLDFDMWTGPAPLRPYNRLYHPRSWRNFMEFGNGIMGDMGIHMFDIARWMLDLGWPTTIESTGGILVDKKSKADDTDTQNAVFDFGSVQVVWQHRTWGNPVDTQYPWSATFYGDKGTLKVGLMSYDFTPKGAGTPVHRDCVYELDQYPEDRTEKDLEKHVAPATRAHMRNFLACIGNRGRPVSDIEEGYISTASCILANLSLQAGRSLTWDSAAGQIKNDPDANQLLRRPYRAPWVHPYPST